MFGDGVKEFEDDVIAGSLSGCSVDGWLIGWEGNAQVGLFVLARDGVWEGDGVLSKEGPNELARQWDVMGN